MSFHFNLPGFSCGTDQQRSRTEFYGTRVGTDPCVTNDFSFPFYREYDIFLCQTTNVSAIVRHFGNYYYKIRTVRYQVYFLSICIQAKFGRPAGRHFLLGAYYFPVDNTFGNHIYFLPVLLSITVSARFPEIPYIFEDDRCVRHMPFGMYHRFGPCFCSIVDRKADGVTVTEYHYILIGEL